ncbi:PemK-like protein [Corynebacterium endometrii]|uniref:PemK-like protein n=2 Tax=Corynebacterium endometrii TaxID=2488819 RepID=A0A4P7QJ86_9CORY|nr:PemK-like protein [Corynebacterium endometrii]
MVCMTNAGNTGRGSNGPLATLLRAFGIEHKQPLELGLTRINERLGLSGPKTTIERRKAAPIRVERTEDHPRSILFSPDIDGQADSGEVVWVWAPTDGPDSLPHERAVLVIARNRSNVLGLLISPNPTHEEEDWWLEIGSGEWDETGRQCWVRLDRVLEISEEDVRRRGILFPQRRFERIANRLRMVYHWA